MRRRQDERGRPRPAEGADASTRAGWWFGLATATTAATLQSFHVLFPDADGLAGRQGNETAAATVVVFATPFLTPGLRRLFGWRRQLALAAVLAMWRLSLLVPEHVPLALAAGGAIVGLLALTLVVTEPAGPQASTSGHNCSDFVLITPALTQQSDVIEENRFDHRPVASTITIRR